MDFRARFAPSPTGQVHIGNIRTAIFNWLEARHNKGTFLLRIEDTDLERSTQDAINKLMECMEWLGMDYDEVPMYQTAQGEKHKASAQKLLENKEAYLLDPSAEKSPVVFKFPYKCDDFKFIRQCGPAELALAPDSKVSFNQTGITFFTVTSKGKVVDNNQTMAGFKDLEILDADGNVLYKLDDAGYDALSDDPSKKVEIEHAAKLKFQRREVFYNDLVKGELAKPIDSMKDFIIVRTDGSPVFHLANVFDDIEQRVTHIVRGDDHVENTYKHLFLFKSLGYPEPSYAHLPMIVNQQGKPYSKRDGDAFVGDFRAKGFLAQALFNYLALLGWSPGDDREKLNREELIEAFSLERALRSPAQMDMKKLTNLNGQYIAELSHEEYMKYVMDYLPAEYAQNPKLDAAAKLMHSRVKTFADVTGWKYFFVSAAELEYDPKGVQKFLTGDTFRKPLEELSAKIAASDGTAAAVEEAIHAVEEANGIKQGHLNQPLRVAVTGTTVGASMAETVEVLGKEETCARIARALSL